MNRALVLALLVALPLAGCLGGNGDADTDDTDDTGAGGSGTSSGTRTVTRTGTATTTSSSTTTATTTATSTSTTTGGPSGNGTDPSGNGTGPAGNGTGPGGNATGNSTGNQTYEWQYENRTGTITGTTVPVVSPTASKEEAFTINRSTKQLVLNLSTTSSTQITLTVSPPGCTTATCATEAKTTGGKARLAFDDPEPGAWKAKLTVSGTGTMSVPYTLAIERLVPSDPTVPPPPV